MVWRPVSADPVADGLPPLTIGLCSLGQRLASPLVKSLWDVAGQTYGPGFDTIRAYNSVVMSMDKPDENRPGAGRNRQARKPAAVRRRAWTCWLTSTRRRCLKTGAPCAARVFTCCPTCLPPAALFAGFYAIIAAMRGDFESAPIAIFFALVLDGLDGRVARLTNTSSKFGAEYDSLSDMVSFGVAPALVMFSWALGGLGKFGWSAAFIYVACAALRLARFNTQIDTADKNYFTGLASPAAACVIASTVWVCHDLGWVGEACPMSCDVGGGAHRGRGFPDDCQFPLLQFQGYRLSRPGALCGDDCRDTGVWPGYTLIPRASCCWLSWPMLSPGR